MGAIKKEERRRRNRNGIAMDSSKYVIVKCSLEMLQSSPDESRRVQTSSRAESRAEARAQVHFQLSTAKYLAAARIAPMETG